MTTGPIHLKDSFSQYAAYLGWARAIDPADTDEAGFPPQEHDCAWEGVGPSLADEVMPGVHLVSSLVKRCIADTTQHNLSRERLAYYLDEYAFRSTAATHARGMRFYRLLQQAVGTDPQPLAALYSSRLVVCLRNSAVV